MIRQTRLLSSLLFCVLFTTASFAEITSKAEQWVLVDNFEQINPLEGWVQVDPDNNTDPYLENPQVTEVRLEHAEGNQYLIKKPAPEGVVGNRKALSYRALPQPVAVGETYTFYTRVNVEYFPNNHSFGLSNLSSQEIAEQNYNAFEPMIRITDKTESNGYKNDGTLMVMTGDKEYSNIIYPATGDSAKPMEVGTWYELWYVVNNAPPKDGGQGYDLYIRGGEFEQQEKVFSNAVFRMQRAQPLIYFVAICNTGSVDDPYGNGGVRYDDIYMVPGLQLSDPRR